MPKRTLVILFVVFSSIAMADKARIAVSQTPLSSPFFVAEQRSLFAAHGVNVEIVDRIGGHRSMNAMLNDEADYATSSDMVIMNNARKGSAFSVLATFVSSALDMALIGSKKTGVTEPSHLEGKKIGVTKGTASHYFADTYVLLAGVPKSSVEIVHVQPEEMGNELIAGKVDAVSTWEPWASKTVEQARGDASMIRDIPAYTLTFNLLAKPELANEAVSTKILKALEAANQWISENPEESKKIVSDRIGTDPSFLDKIWDNYVFSLRLEQSLILTLESELDWSNSINEDQNLEVNFLDYFETGPLKSLNSSFVAIAK